MVQAVDRLHFEAPHLAFLQHVERDSGPCAPLRPDLAIKIGQALRLLALDTDDHIAALDAGPLRRTARRHATDNSRPRISSVLSPSQGRPAPAVRPAEIRSPRIGASRSIGTNMLPSQLPANSRLATT